MGETVTLRVETDSSALLPSISPFLESVNSRLQAWEAEEGIRNRFIGRFKALISREFIKTVKSEDASAPGTGCRTVRLSLLFDGEGFAAALGALEREFEFPSHIDLSQVVCVATNTLAERPGGVESSGHQSGED